MVTPLQLFNNLSSERVKIYRYFPGSILSVSPYTITPADYGDFDEPASTEYKSYSSENIYVWIESEGSSDKFVVDGQTQEKTLVFFQKFDLDISGNRGDHGGGGEAYPLESSSGGGTPDIIRRYNAQDGPDYSSNYYRVVKVETFKHPMFTAYSYKKVTCETFGVDADNFNLEDIFG